MNSFKKYFILLALVAVIWPLSSYFPRIVKLATEFPITADEAAHLEIVENLYQRSWYGQWGGDPFSPHLTTGPSILIPAALLQMMTDVPSAISGRATAIFFAMGIFSIFLIAWRRKFGPTCAMLGAGLLALFWRAIRDTEYASYGVFGEGASIFFLFLSFLFFEKNKFTWAGIATWLAFFSKPYLILLPFSSLGWMILSRKSRSDILRHLLGQVSVLGAIAGLMVHQSGWATMVRTWTDFPKTMMRANHGAWDSALESSFISVMLRHWEGIPDLFSRERGIFLLVLFAVFAFVQLRAHFRSKTWRFSFPLIFALIHFVWWTVSRGLEVRYAYPWLMGLAWVGMDAIFLRLQKKLPPAKLAEAISSNWAILIYALGMVSLGAYSFRSDSPLSFQIQFQQRWKALSERRPVWSTSADYSQDQDLMLSAARVVRWPTLGLDQIPVGEWILVGINANQKIKKELLNNDDFEPLIKVPRNFGDDPLVLLKRKN